VGMWPTVDASIWPGKVPIPSHLTVFDLVYNPLETRLLRLARQSGARAIDGLGMLVRQGALSFDMWTNQGLDIDEIAALMRAAAQEALAGT
jgi:shikimate 5-dehydrogenase